MSPVVPRRGVGIRACLTALVALGSAGAFVTVDGQSAPPPPSPTASAIASGPATDLLAPGRLVICSSFPRVRFAEWAADGGPVGVDIEIGTGIADALGLEPVVRAVPFDTLIDGVVDRGCDVSIAGQFITAARLERIAMIAYRAGTPHVIVRAGDPMAIDELGGRCGRSLAVVSGTVYVDMVRGVGDYAGIGLDDRCAAVDLPAIDLREHSDQASAEGALAADEVQAYIGNDFITQDRPDEFALSVELLPTRNGIGHRIDAPGLGRAIRAALATMIEDGSYQAILDRHGVGHVAIDERP